MLITYQAKLLERKQLAGDVYLFRFSYPENEGWDYKAGQYMIMHIPQAEGMPARRLYSIASPPSQKSSLDFIIQILPNGVAGPHLMSLEMGTEVTMQGPAGLFTFKDSPADVVMLATGTGIAPMYSMILDQLQVQKNPNNIHVFFGLKTCADLYLFDEFKNLSEQYSNLHFNLCLSREDQCNMKLPETDMHYVTVGRVTHGVETLWTQGPLDNADYYVCGSKEVVESLREYLAEKGIAKEDVHFEKFT